MAKKTFVAEVTFKQKIVSLSTRLFAKTFVQLLDLSSTLNVIIFQKDNILTFVFSNVNISIIWYFYFNTHFVLVRNTKK